MKIRGRVHQSTRSFLKEVVFFSVNLICGRCDRKLLKSVEVILLIKICRNKGCLSWVLSNISIIYHIEDSLYLEFARSSGYRVFETKWAHCIYCLWFYRLRDLLLTSLQVEIPKSVRVSKKVFRKYISQQQRK